MSPTLRATGTPAVFVTHDQHEALAIGDRIAVMRSGRIRQVGTPAEVYHRPADRFIGAFMGAASFLQSLITARRHSVPSTLMAVNPMNWLRWCVPMT